MKFDKSNPIHWWFLALSSAVILLSLPFRIFRNNNKKRLVFFYQMHGNAQVLVNYLMQNDDKFELYFCAFPEYLKKYEGKHNLPSLNVFNLFDMIKVARCDAVITNYRPHTLIFYAKLTNIKFFDVGHGIPVLKKFSPEVLRYLKGYTEVWVSSPKIKADYKNLYKVTAPVYPTGYGRTDNLINSVYKNIREKYGLPKDKKIVMFAPTWQQNPKGSIFPFGASEEEFINILDSIGQKTKSQSILRVHMLSNLKTDFKNYKHVKLMSVKDYPDTEELLSVTDILVSDWSSLVFDFLPTKNPTIFLDVPPPFAGKDQIRRIDKTHRFGEIASSYNELEASISMYIDKPSLFNKKFREKIKKAEDFVYGDTLDGHSTERYYKRLIKHLG